jgi:hypothetical protein
VVIEDSEPEPARTRLEAVLSRLEGLDDRVHLHVIRPDEVPPALR